MGLRSTSRGSLNNLFLVVDSDQRGRVGQNGSMVDDRVGDWVIDRGSVDDWGGDQLGRRVDNVAMLERSRQI